MEHNKLVLVGFLSGLLSGIFLLVFQEWKNEGIWAFLVPLFVIAIYFILASPISYRLLKREEKLENKG